MHFGGAMFFTDYSMPAPELARALEERDFESVLIRRWRRMSAPLSEFIMLKLPNVKFESLFAR